MTDNTSDTPNGLDTGVGEPSMEDILASIRRIIAEDDVADQNHLDVGSGIESLSEAPVTAPVEFVTDTVETDSDVLILDQLVNDIGSEISDLSDFETEELVLPADEEEDFNPVSSVVSDLEDRLAIDRPDSDLIPELEVEDVVFSSDGIENIPPKPSDTLVLNNADMDFEDDLSELLETSVDETEDLVLEDVEETLQVDTDLTLNTNELEDDGDSDLDIVKSLMADLADTSFLDEDDEPGAAIELDDTADSLVDEELSAIDDMLTEDLTAIDSDDLSESLDDVMDLVVQDDPVDLSLDAESEAETDEIMNDILELAIQDEVEINDDLDLAVDDDLIIPDPGPEPSGDKNSLLQIAMEAEADADAMDGSKVIVAGAGAAMAAATAAVLSDDNTADEELVDLELHAEDAPSTEDLLNELDLALAEVSQDDNQEEAEPDPEPVPEPELEPETVVAAEAETTELFLEPEETEEMARTARKESIINEVTEEATADAFAELSQAVEEKAVFTESGPRIGDIVQDALRPMLKEWLDANLKSIVERAVAKEVKRISSGK